MSQAMSVGSECGACCVQDYVQNEQEKRVLMEWAQLLRARQEAAKAIELANVRASCSPSLHLKP